MPRLLLPKKSTEHRVAAIALYRALLLRCSQAPIHDDARTELRNAIRSKFRKDRKIEGTHRLGLSFRAGYATLDQLDASIAGDTSSKSNLLTLIAALPAGLKRIPRKRPSTFFQASEVSKARLVCLPPESAVLNRRPLRTTSGPRQVPVLTAAQQSIPFLRLKKPQPPSLSRIIRQKLKRREEIMDRRIYLANWWMALSQREDEWDQLIGGLTKKREDDITWSSAVSLSVEQNQAAFFDEVKKDRSALLRMREIIEEETKLALSEGRTILRGRKKKPLSIIRPHVKP